MSHAITEANEIQQLFGKPVAEILVGRILAQVGERQYGNRVIPPHVLRDGRRRGQNGGEARAEGQQPGRDQLEQDDLLRLAEAPPWVAPSSLRQGLELADAMLLSGNTGQPVDVPVDRTAFDAWLASKRGE